MIKPKVWYYIDEFTILLFVLIGIVLSEAIAQRAKGGMATWDSIYIDTLNLAISSLLALIAYSSMHIEFKYNDKQKPPYLKRATNGLLSGIAWRTILEGVN